MADLNLGRPQTGIIHVLNKTPIYWYSKSQYWVGTATYGSEYAAACVYTNHIFELFNNLRYLGVILQMFNVSDDSFMFGDEFLVLN